MSVGERERTAKESTGSFRSLRNRNYRIYAVGQLTSLTGTWMQRVAQDWVVLELSNNSAVALALVTTLQFGPAMLLSLWGGLLADRNDKRRLLILAQIAFGTQAFVFALLEITSLITLWQVFILSALFGVTNALEKPARQAFIAELVSKDDLGNAVALNSSIFNGARVAGPVIAGVMISWVGASSVFMLNALSILPVILGLVVMNSAQLRPAPLVPKYKGQIIEGLRYLGSRRDLLFPIGLVFVAGILGFNFPIALALLTKQEFDDAAAYGILLALFGAGTLCGALLSTRRINRLGERSLLIVSVLFGIGQILIGLISTFTAVGIALIFTGVFSQIILVSASSAVQLGTKSRMRGRVAALYIMCLQASALLGALFVGIVSHSFGVRAVFIVGGISSILAALLLGAKMASRDLPCPVDSQTPAPLATPIHTRQ